MLPWFRSEQIPLYLAPMAGVTDSVFRRLCKELGADVVVTEFVSADGILHRNQRTREMVAFCSEERPLGVQLFGADPDKMAEAARAVVDWVQPDFVDLNFGCPVNKIVSRHGGSALLRDCPLLEKVASRVAQALKPVPVTAKIRLGWDAYSINAVQTARILEDSGICALAVHGRTKEQGYSGCADWEQIGRVAEAVSIPVIGNGDLRTVKEVRDRLAQTRVRGLMFGRAVMTNPWLFCQIKAFLNSAALVPEPSLEERWAHILRHCRLAVQENGPEHFVMSSLRSRLMAYSKGMPESRSLREAFQRVTSISEMESIASRHIEDQSTRESALMAV
jgi:tRNA-dihydrouridine synthase B